MSLVELAVVVGVIGVICITIIVGVAFGPEAAFDLLSAIIEILGVFL